MNRSDGDKTARYTAATAAAWQTLWQQHDNAAAGAAPLFRSLRTLYQQPPRAYHNLTHVDHVLHVVATLAAHADDPATVRLAAWLHDIIYEPRAADNEARSAALARSWLQPTWGGAVAAEVARLIYLTASHTAAPGDRNGLVLLDADLAVLGSPPACYDAYAQAIRREYRFLDDADFRSGRAGVLRRFLARPAIYHTPPLQATYEERARDNLARELATLTATPC